MIDHKMSKLQGTELTRICTAQKDYAYIVTFCGRICKGNGVKKTWWKIRCEKDIVTKTL